MQAPAQKSAKLLWLPLLVVFVLCAGITDPVLRADGLLPEIVLEVGGERSSSADGNGLTGFTPESFVNQFLSVSPYYPDSLPPGTGSDAYPSNITHGPPARVIAV